MYMGVGHLETEKTRLISRDYVLAMVAVMGTNFVNYFFFSTLSMFAKTLTDTVRYAGYLSLAYSATALVVRPLSGFFSDRHGRVKLIIFGTALCTVSCLCYTLTPGLVLASFTPGIILLVIVRILNGIGMSSSTTSAGAAIPDIVPKPKLAEGIGIFGVGNTLAQALGPTIALAIVADGELSSFNTLFFIAAAFCAVSCVSGCFIKYERTGKRNNPPGAIPAIGETPTGAPADALADALDESGLAPAHISDAAAASGQLGDWTDGGTPAGGDPADSEADVGGGTAVSIETADVETADVDTTVSVGGRMIFGIEPQIFGLFMVLMVYFIGISGVLSFLTLFAQDRGFQVEYIGLFFFVSAAGVLLSRLVCGKVVDKRGADVIVIPGLLVMAACLAMIPIAPSLPLLICVALPYGIASGAVGPAFNATMFKRSSPNRRGAVSAAYYVAVDVGITLGTPVMGLIADYVKFEWVYWISAVAVCLAFLLYLRFGSDRRYQINLRKEATS